ncbi:hypothetical protein C8Q79DRAFT_322194 [Trametes meyenii]|nr:hypothetical protein C8Q79DRAFT_322194 [Trametes meyenii]
MNATSFRPLLNDLNLDHTDVAGLLYRAGNADTWRTLKLTSGAMLIGGQIALFLSGIVTLQVILYHQLYHSDTIRLKALVFAIWGLDMLHSAMICVINWQGLVVNYGNFDYFGTCSWSMAMVIGVAAWTTILVQSFFTYRIHTLSDGNWYVTGTLGVLSLLRLVAAMVSCAELFRFGRFDTYFAHFKSLFLLGLSVSTLVDILVTAILCYYLRKRRSGLVWWADWRLGPDPLV